MTQESFTTFNCELFSMRMRVKKDRKQEIACCLKVSYFTYHQQAVTGESSCVLGPHFVCVPKMPLAPHKFENGVLNFEYWFSKILI